YTAPVLSQSGYTFDGWFTDAACTGAYVAAVDAITADITLYAKFTADVPDTYTVTLEAGTSNNDLADITGATNYVATETATEGVSYTAPVLSQSGYTFDGWFTDAACTGAYVAAVDAITADITLYAKWTAAVLNIDIGGTNYDLNGTLPSELSWDNDNQVLTMTDYTGTYIHKASGEYEANALNNLTIEVSGDNNVLQSGQETGTILGFDNLTIQGTGKLLVKQTQYAVGINVFSVSDKGLTVKGSVELTVEVEHKVIENRTYGIHGNATLENTAKLVVAVNKTASGTDGAYGISGNLTLNGEGDVTITVTDAGSGAAKAVSGDVDGGNTEKYKKTDDTSQSVDWTAASVDAKYVE
ncbi:MAG: InlB B-repeat-containing protein, partial [Eubacteriales bacterium]|nr:InlB B-repeat-containing protein [Eubacteriales bacterium]